MTANKLPANNKGSDSIAITELETPRLLTFNIFRHNPADENSQVHRQKYLIEEAPSMTLFIALNEIRATQDPSLQFDFVCRAGICGSCAMLINAKPGLACRTLTKDLPDIINLAPLPGFNLIGDLSVNTGEWMRGMSERLETWIHLQEELVDLSKIEEKMAPKLATDIYELERCIECGCCIAACGTAQMRESFIAGVGINQIARYKLDPRDKRTDADYYQVIGTENGVFGCMTLLGCEDTCPKNLPLAQQIAYMRRKMALVKD
ncbi:fumarate reductase iron-sulfur subunit [Colwellia sp. M166]|uniref:fumarate reductase iron-sulfur subunit n=1 Tax=Colwellia sp. M166 TaxID=2583805 RepID=UPI000C996548|nr:fumarate reductase iron-sulfur subunit [Colwellia sp. M166]MAD77089.1 succinate dehydrogenase/fumarate reductase iron-sulfur subunit [Rheinheimera sp.]UUO24362.1 fumarate reductase iron-sulfur subunit [Colwellia sp. M166]|tara:strand:+ start:16839 stop:17627 length:789 start_codon:yes stop_codon:yes gene_type:complete